MGGVLLGRVVGEQQQGAGDDGRGEVDAEQPVVGLAERVGALGEGSARARAARVCAGASAAYRVIRASILA